MGSEGYLINQFIAQRTNHRDDDWGGAFDNRIRFAVETVRRTRAGGRAATSSSSTGCRCSTSSKAAARGTRSSRSRARSSAAGATLINTGDRLARGAHPDDRDDGAARRVHVGDARGCRARCGMPLITTNRINDPGVAEAILARGDADMVSMARPFLADRGVRRQGGAGDRADEINTCIALQPGVPRPHLRARDRDVPRQSVRVPRDRARADARRAPASASPSSARVRRDSRARRPPPSAAIG